MKNFKEIEQAARDQLVEAHLKTVGATICPPATHSETVSPKLPSAEDRVMRSDYYASLTYRELNGLELASCTEDGVDESQKKGKTGDE